MIVLWRVGLRWRLNGFLHRQWIAVFSYVGYYRHPQQASRVVHRTTSSSVTPTPTAVSTTAMCLRPEQDSADPFIESQWNRAVHDETDTVT